MRCTWTSTQVSERGQASFAYIFRIIIDGLGGTITFENVKGSKSYGYTSLDSFDILETGEWFPSNAHYLFSLLEKRKDNVYY